MYAWHVCSRWYTPESTQLSLTFKHFSHHGTKAYIPVHNKSVSNLCSQEVTACFTCVSLANHLPSSCFLWGKNMWKSLGPILPTTLVTGYGTMAEQLWTTLLAVSISCPVISTFLNPSRSTWLASDLRKLPT